MASFGYGLFDGLELFKSDVTTAFYDIISRTFQVHTGFHQTSLAVDFYLTKIGFREKMVL